MSQRGTFTDVVLGRAAERPDRDAYLFLHAAPDSLDAEHLTYRELDHEVRRLAAWLVERGLRRERVLIAQSDGRSFAVSFLACLYAGAVAVPVAPPHGLHHADRVLGTVKDAGVALVLTGRSEALVVSQLLAAGGYQDIPCLAVDAAELPDAGDWQRPELTEDDLALLQYTSGSTSAPKGVMVTHRMLLANQRAIWRSMRTGADTRIGGWLPHHHDMGLVGQLLHPLWLGGTGVLLPSYAFVRRPVRWLEAVSRYGITASAGPNFGYELCVRRVTDAQLAGLDLSHWETAVNGAEPVSAETMRRFAERFGPVGFRPEAFVPAYGLAEGTLHVTGGRAAGAARPPVERVVDAEALAGNRLREASPGVPARTVVGCGQATDVELRIVDPDSREPLPEGQVGEIWLRGESISPGYWKQPGAGENRGSLGEEHGYLRTGDLGALDGGELFVTGRLKDSIVVAGRNLYPQDIERTVQKVSALFASGAVFGVGQEAGGEQSVVVVQEVRVGRHDLDLPALASAVRRCVAQEFEVRAGGVLLVRPGTVRRTTSGKLERAAMRSLFLDGRLKPLHEFVEPSLAGLRHDSPPGWSTLPAVS